MTAFGGHIDGRPSVVGRARRVGPAEQKQVDGGLVAVVRGRVERCPAAVLDHVGRCPEGEEHARDGLQPPGPAGPGQPRRDGRLVDGDPCAPQRPERRGRQAGVPLLDENDRLIGAETATKLP